MKFKSWFSVGAIVCMSIFLPQRGSGQVDYCALFGSPFGCITNISPAYGRPGTSFQVTFTAYDLILTTTTLTCGAEIAGISLSNTMVPANGTMTGTLSIPAMFAADTFGAKIYMSNLGACNGNYLSCVNCFTICGPCDAECTIKEKLDNNLATVAELVACGENPCDIYNAGAMVALADLITAGASIAALLDCFPACDIYGTDPSTLNSLLAAGVAPTDLIGLCLVNNINKNIAAQVACGCPLLLLNNIASTGTRIDDPCNCNDPLNVPANPGGYLFHDVLTITTAPNVQITLVSGTGFLDGNGVAIPNNTVLGTTDINGVLTYDFWHLSNVQAIAVIDNTIETSTFTSDLCDGASCNPIPTLSQWATMILALWLMIVGVVWIKTGTRVMD